MKYDEDSAITEMLQKRQPPLEGPSQQTKKLKSTKALPNRLGNIFEGKKEELEGA